MRFINQLNMVSNHFRFIGYGDNDDNTTYILLKCLKCGKVKTVRFKGYKPIVVRCSCSGSKEVVVPLVVRNKMVERFIIVSNAYFRGVENLLKIDSTMSFSDVILRDLRDNKVSDRLKEEICDGKD